MTNVFLKFKKKTNLKIYCISLEIGNAVKKVVLLIFIDLGGTAIKFIIFRLKLGNFWI